MITFKRAKRIIALHYGAPTFSTRKLCRLFRHTQRVDKQTAILAEATRILQLRDRLGYYTTDAGIDATMALAVNAQHTAHQSARQKQQRPCLVCKHLLSTNGMQATLASYHVCPGDCYAIEAPAAQDHEEQELVVTVIKMFSGVVFLTLITIMAAVYAPLIVLMLIELFRQNRHYRLAA